MAKYVLNIEEDEIDFDMLGICSALNDYRMAWEINHLLDIKLKKSDKKFKNIPKKKAIPSFHGMYNYEDESLRTGYFLIKNKSISTFLIPELSQIDFLLFLKNPHPINLDEWVEKIKQCHFIQAAFQFQPEAYKSCEKITFDEYEKN